MTGKLILCATPIGNLGDISQRALRTLEDADTIACEDTRRTRKLLGHYGIKARRLVVYHEGNERRRATELLGRIAAGETLVLVSDAGMPGLSDPGYHLVRGCAQRDLVVEVVPGPNAAVSAVALSGLPPGRFVFEGFLPRKRGERRRRISELAAERRTIVFYESPHRIEACLADLLDVLDDRPAAIARELTKMYEETLRGRLSELGELARAGALIGELVVVVSGAVQGEGPEMESAELARRARELMESGVTRKEAMSAVAHEAGVARRRVFDALVEAGGDEQERNGESEVD